MKALPVPRDFKKNAAVMTKAQLRRRYKRGDQTIQRWCILSGAEPKPGRKAAERPWKFTQCDAPEQIKMCLNCAFPDCRGWCAKMAAAKAKKNAPFGASQRG